MRIPHSWLSEILPTDLSPEEIAEVLTNLGLEVDGVEATALSFQGVVVGEVLEAGQHPEADRLKVAKVTDGTEEFEIVCGAPNCRKGIRVALAKIGAKIGDHKIKKGKLRGVTSYGMLCAAVELGLGEDDGSIMELPEWPLGEDLSSFYGDAIFEISLTPNLGHCYSLLGVARELGAALEIPLQLPKAEVAVEGPAPKVSLEAPDLCIRYACRTIRGVQVGASPPEVQQKLEACGIRSINNIVDITNLVMLELGQPMHAFDLNRLNGVHIRKSEEGEIITTLDGVERTLPAGLALVCDAVGGVIGGQESQVTEATTDILLEAAYFDPSAVRRASKLLGVKTESSRRFERGCDPTMLHKALDRAASLIAGKASPITDVGKTEWPLRRIDLRTTRVNKLLGTHLTPATIEALLRRLHLQPKGESVGIPPFRSDLQTEIDLVEEVARLYGYNKLIGDAAHFRIGNLADAPEFLFEEQLRHKLIAQGLQEVLAPSLVKEGDIAIVNPSSEDLSNLRSSLLPGMVQIAHHNRDHRIHDLALFEIGRVHTSTAEEPRVAILLMGRTAPPFWEEGREFDFYDLKGICEALCPEGRFTKGEHPKLHPGRQASIEGVGYLGELRSERIFYAELSILSLKRPKTAQIAPLPQFPGTERDWTLTVKEETPAASLLETIAGARSKLLQNVQPIAIYRSATIGEGWKNMTFRFAYRDDKKTISDKAVEMEQGRLQRAVTESLGENYREE